MSLSVTVQKIILVLPSSRVNMVLMQPFLRFETPLSEPFRWERNQVPRQISRINRTLSIACQNTVQSHFTLFPEYSVPGLQGIRAIDERVRSDSWHSNSVLIAGLDGLSYEEFSDVLDYLRPTLQDAEDLLGEVNADSWVNCSVTFVKENAGTVRAWIQPKIAAASMEEFAPNAAMHRGDKVNLFECQFDNSTPCHFASFLCFDWIGRVGGDHVQSSFLQSLNQLWIGTRKPLHWIFVLQHNKSPNHYTFLDSTKRFLSDAANHASIDRRDTAVVMVCTANGDHPSNHDPFGFTSFVFAPRASVVCRSLSPPTYTTKAKLRHSNRTLEPCYDLAFRETGECIHACEVRVPSFVTPDPSDREFPIRAKVHCVDGNSSDPRLSGKLIPAAIKWINDELDCMASLSAQHFGGKPHGEEIHRSEEAISLGYRNLSGAQVVQRLRVATQTTDDVDEWMTPEREALIHVANTLGLLGAGIPVDIGNTSLHGSFKDNDVEVAAVRCLTHEECRAHFEASNASTHSGVLLVTRDKDNTTLTPEEVTKIYEGTKRSGISVVDFQSIFEIARSVGNANELSKRIRELADVGEPPII